MTQIANTCSAGTISGNIKDAVSGSVVSGVSLSLRSGMNVTSGTIVATATSDNSGNYSFSNMSAGWYTVQTSKSGYTDAKFNVYSCGNQSGQNANISTTLSSGSMRIVLTWQGSKDLDTHLEIPCTSGTCSGSNKNDKSHLWYSVNQTAAVTYSGVSTKDYHDWGNGDYVTLDQDNTDGSGSPCGAGCGPETITISKIRSGTYRYHVHAYARSGDNTTHIADNGTVVQVFYNIDQVLNFDVPNSAGDLWTVFDYNNSSGFNTLNTMSSEATPGSVDDH